MVRAATAAAEQLEAIKLLKKYNMLDNLKKELKDAAALREAYPEAGLSELVSLSTEAVSKSGLNYRLKKLVSLAEDLKTEE
jgi:DNA-binding protein WhiA